MSINKVLVYASAALVLFIDYANGGTAPPFIHPCNSTDSACLTKAAQTAIPEFVKGIPEFGIPILDPIEVNDLKLTLPGGLEFAFYDGKSTGLKNCIINKVSIKLGKHQELDMQCNLTMKGKYRSQGRILLFNIDGSGDAKIKITNIHLKIKQKMNLITDESGVHRIKINNVTHIVDYEGNVHFHFTNLFKNSPEISQAILNFLNENWKLVIVEFGKPILDYFVNLANENVQKFYKNVAYEDLIGVPFDEALNV